MSVIIRLQNLPWSANALDIRQHFQGLSIPEGGVHIVGGEQGDAFIAFSTDEDARQAMMNGDGKIKEVKVKLLLSSRTEMQKVIEQARQQSVSLQNLLQMPAPPIIAPAPVPVVAPVITIPDPPKVVERRDSDTNSDKDRRSERKDRSRSRDRRRRSRERKSRSRSRERRRPNDSRRRRRTSRDRRSRSRSRDRRRPMDNRRNSRERNDRRRDSIPDDIKKPDQNGSSKPDLIPGVGNNAWDIVSGGKLMGFSKAPVIPHRGVVPAVELASGRGDMDGRRIMGSGPFPSGSTRPIPSAGAPDNIPGPFQGNRDSWQSRSGAEIGGRFPPADRQGSFTGDSPRVGFGSESNDFDGRGDFLPRAGPFRGGTLRGSGEPRRPPFLPGRPSGPGSILGPPGTMMGSSSFPRGPGPADSFHRGERPFEAFSSRSSFNSFPNRTYDPRLQIPGTCVEIRNLSLDSGYSDIRKFFQGIYVANNAIKMLNDAKGHRTGIAYIKFANSDAKERSMKMTGKQIRGSVIEILHLDDEIFENSVDSYKPDSSSYKPDSSSYKPDSSSYKGEHSSYKLEQNLYKAEPSVFKPDSRSKPDISVQMTKTDEPMIIDNTSPCLQIQDLPPYTTESDIRKLFSVFKVSDVVISYHKDDKKQAMAYVKFVRPEDGKAAMFSTQKHMIGHTTVKVSLCSLELYQMAKNLNPKVAAEVPSNGSQVKDPRSRVEHEPQGKASPAPVLPLSDCILLKGLPYQTNDRDILDFFSDCALVPARIHVMLDNFNKPSGDAYCEFGSCEETVRAVAKNGTILGKQEVTVKPVMRHDMLEALGLLPQQELLPPNMHNMHGGPRLPFMRSFPGHRPMGILGNRPLRMPMRGGHMMMAHMGMGHLPPKEQVEGFGKPGCILALENIPFRAEVDEILQFFADFDVSRDNIIRRFNDMGMPTGDARVSLGSPMEAQRAFRELRGQQIRGRPIFVNLL